MLELVALVGIGVAGIAGLGVVGVGIDALQRRVRQRIEQSEDPAKRALAVLMERYANGEITQDEFLERRSYIELAAEDFKRGRLSG